MNRYEIIGRGERASYPYDIGIFWGSNGARPIALGEGRGHGSAGGAFTLAEMLDDKWTENLEICDCGWLRKLARAESARESPFSADELWQRAQQR